MRRKPFVLVLSGPSGAGKSTFVAGLLQTFPDLGFSVSATTRPRRPHEVEGRDYYFLAPAEFERRVTAGEFLEHASVHGARYGTLESEVASALRGGKSVLLDVDVQGGVSVKRRIADAVLVFVLPPSLQVLEQRLRQRGTEDEDVIQLRLQRAPDEIRCLVEYDYVVVNDTLAETRDELEAICRAERLRRERLQDDAGGADVVSAYLRVDSPRGR
ncbi:MAG TPA: guanylate kinase [Candidatus Krumholzibacteria bacterium]|nr:guanylate kinase [Candidatus Krumholzibacteria bacterium]